MELHSNTGNRIVPTSRGHHVRSQEINQENKRGAASTAIEETKPALTAEGKTEAKRADDDYSMGQEKRFVATTGSDGVQHVEVIGGEYYFYPDYIVAKLNIPVELTCGVRECLEYNKCFAANH